MSKNVLFSRFRDTGRDIFLRGLISSHAGNMSVRIGNKMFITKRGSMMGRLKPSDIVELELKKESAIDYDVTLSKDWTRASSETIVHKAIYEKTGFLAIVHAHPPYATLLSILKKELIPCDSEGCFMFQKIPVVTPKKTIGSEESAEMVSECLQSFKIVLVRGHGSFAAGSSLEESQMLTTSLESSAFFLYHLSKA